MAAIRFLEARYGRDVPQGEGRTFDLAAFQEDAVRRAKEISRRWGGVLVADSVGLGKTYVALALIEEELNRGGRVLVVTPAALRSQWQTPLRRIARERRGTSALWVSHTRLSRGGISPNAAKAFDLVVVDEAHGFRNPATRRYRELARLCRGARVVLLTATPVNNSPLDLYAQIRLFAGDGAFHSLGVTDMRAAFRATALRPDAALPAPV
ncbi:MAG: SNF2-related protein, partial [Longimicrobiales bacterium]